MVQHDCERIQLLISAQLDGELDRAEQDELAVHLRGCPVCLDFRRACRQLAFSCAEWSLGERESAEASPDPVAQPNGHDVWKLAVRAEGAEVVASTTAPVGPGSKSTGSKAAPAIPAGSVRGWASATWMWATVAAGLLIAVFASAVWQLWHPPEPPVSLDPLLVRYASNVETQQDQQSTLRIVQMDLRTMRLELDQLQLDPAVRAQLDERIESLLAKTNQLREFPITNRGENR